MEKKARMMSLLFLIIVFPGLALAQKHKANINDWPETAKKAAKAMMEKYGAPDEQVESMMIWNNTGPFTHTIVYKEEVQHNFPMPHKDVLEQVINYDVPADMFDDLAHYDGSVIAERTKGTLAARCDKEGANYLALNLAHDIIEGEKTVDEARRYYADAMMKMLQGQKDDYLTGLQFKAPDRNINNPDKTVMDMSRVRELKKN